MAAVHHGQQEHALSPVESVTFKRVDQSRPDTLVEEHAWIQAGECNHASVAIPASVRHYATTRHACDLPCGALTYMRPSLPFIVTPGHAAAL